MAGLGAARAALLRSAFMAASGDIRRRLGRAAGWALAVALLAAAVAAAWREVDPTVLLRAEPWPLAVLLAAVAVNLWLTAMLFWVVTRSFDARPTVGIGRMTALIAASHLLNYLPLVRAGLVGRAAYLKARHALPLRQSVVILGVILALAVVVFAAAAAVLLAMSRTPAPARWAALLGLWLVLAALTGAVSRRLLRRPVRWPWAWVPLRAADLFVAALRMWVAFAVMDVPVAYTEAVIIAAGGLLVRLVGLTPNGLGLSEWVVAALAAALTPVATAAGAAAALLDRAAEVLVTGVAGLAGLWWLRG